MDRGTEHLLNVVNKDTRNKQAVAELVAKARGVPVETVKAEMADDEKLNPLTKIHRQQGR